jgi:signal transduction histidine kinase
MTTILDQVISLLSGPGGNLIYSLVLGLYALAALVSCLYAGSSQQSEVGRRMRPGLTVLFVAQLVLFGAACLAWGKSGGHTFLPAIDRSLALFSLVVIIWLWVFPERNPTGDLIATVAGGVILLLGLGSVILWITLGSSVSFNSYALEGYAYYAGLGLLIAGVILLLVRQPRYWGYAMLMLVILLTGYLGQFFRGQAEADYDWYIHLGMMVGYLLLLALPLRLVNLRQAGVPVDKSTTMPLGPLETSKQLIQSTVNLLSEHLPQKYYQELTRVVAQIMNADFCLLLMPPKTGEQLIMPVGYSRPDDRLIDGLTTDGRKMPIILEAIKTGKNLQLSSNLLIEVQALAEMVGMKQAANFMMVPFHPKGSNAIMALAVLSSYTATMWNNEDAIQLIDIEQLLISISGQYSKGVSPQADQAEMMEKLQRSQASADQTRLEYAQLKAKYDSISTQPAISAPLAVEMAALVESQKNLQGTITQLEARNRELESLLARGRPSVEEVEQLRQELRATLVDLARMPSTLSKSDQKMLELQLSTVKRLDDMEPTELVNSIAQEFRQPLASIIGYTDLLLGESVGLLGAVQRKFVERVKASTERMGILLNELVQVISIDGGTVDQTAVSVDLKTVIDEALGNIAGQISEKNIDMRVELPDRPVTVRVNQDALLQILENLLQNACLVAPADGWIRLLATVEQEENAPGYIHISVTDQGGGIEKTDISRVFLRRYKMENPLIQGIGDTGVGLSIVKSLVELNKGRVWVDSKEGTGATFSVLLPVAEEQSNQSSQSVPTG